MPITAARLHDPARGTVVTRNTAPTAAPPVTPRTPGSASGLRVTAWTSAPQGECRAREERREGPGRPGVEDEGDGPARPALCPVHHVAEPQLAVAQQHGGDRHPDEHRRQYRCGGQEDGPAPGTQPVGCGSSGGVPDPGGHRDQEHGADEAGGNAGRHDGGHVGRHDGAQEHVRAEHQHRAGEARDRNARPRPGDGAESAGEGRTGAGAHTDPAWRASHSDRRPERDTQQAVRLALPKQVRVWLPGEKRRPGSWWANRTATTP